MFAEHNEKCYGTHGLFTIPKSLWTVAFAITMKSADKMKEMNQQKQLIPDYVMCK